MSPIFNVYSELLCGTVLHQSGSKRTTLTDRGTCVATCMEARMTDVTTFERNNDLITRLHHGVRRKVKAHSVFLDVVQIRLQIRGAQLVGDCLPMSILFWFCGLASRTLPH